MKFTCIIDTCSCAYLERVEFRQKSLLKHLYDTNNIIHSKEVGLEIREHADKLNMPEFIQATKLRIKTEKYTMPEYERRMNGSEMTSRVPGGNKGEIDNFALAIDQMHHLKKRQSVFITDDKTALNGV